MADRAHLSIGEVLSLLREEFPDVTISKIRFLESQGLLDPERTPSGYRKFYDEDVERLRWILRQQRENFLPLKVIKGRLVDHPDGAQAPEPLTEAFSSAPAAQPSQASQPVAPMPQPAAAAYAAASAHRGTPVAAAPPASPAAPPPATPPAPTTTDAAAASNTAWPQHGASAGSTATPSVSSGALPGRAAMVAPSGGNYTLDELASVTGLTEAAIEELAGFGLIGSRDVGGTVYFDEDAATIAALAAGFARHGIEARHLRMYKNAAERESSLFEQIVMPLVKQRNPQARQQAATALEDLGRLSGELRRALLRQALGHAF